MMHSYWGIKLMDYKSSRTGALRLRLLRRRAGPARLAGGSMSTGGFSAIAGLMSDDGPGSGDAGEGEAVAGR
jgi:hypothetical protein